MLNFWHFPYCLSRLVFWAFNTINKSIEGRDVNIMYRGLGLGAIERCFHKLSNNLFAMEFFLNVPIGPKCGPWFSFFVKVVKLCSVFLYQMFAFVPPL